MKSGTRTLDNTKCGTVEWAGPAYDSYMYVPASPSLIKLCIYPKIAYAYAHVHADYVIY